MPSILDRGKPQTGLHISILGMTFYRIVRKFVRQPPAVVLSLFFMSLIVTMTGNSVSAIRALIMYIINLIGEIGGYNYDILSALSLAAISIDEPGPTELARSATCTQRHSPSKLIASSGSVEFSPSIA